ncbi:cytochrome P450 [Flammula alnicola]|nr:cytochrome P450 [Flammula alnicola]
MALSDLTISILLAIIPLAGVVFGLYTSYSKWLESPFRKVSYPPGPPQQGLLSGILRDTPWSQPWVTYSEWARKYGDIIHFKLYGRHVIVLNSMDDAIEMFERRCNVYSDRPKNLMSGLTGWDFNTGLMPYGEEWRRHRKLYQQCFRPKASLAYRPIQTQKIRNMLLALLDAPDEFGAHCKTSGTGIILSLLYGHDLTSETSNYFVGLAEEAKNLADAPILAPIFSTQCPCFDIYHRLALDVKKVTDQMLDVPMDFVGKGLLEGTAGPSLVADLLENCYVQSEFNRIKKVTASTYAGKTLPMAIPQHLFFIFCFSLFFIAGADTTISSLLSFFLAMAQFPDAQNKAQNEIDRIVGLNRLPDYEDRSSLPYVEALYREVMRWKPPIPLNTAHTSTEADIIMASIFRKNVNSLTTYFDRSMTRNEDKYPDPELFIPDRFLDGEGGLNDDDVTLVFGFGRRICPGRHLALQRFIWLLIVSVLATFDIRKKKDSSGNEIPLNGKYADGIISQPLPFECSITPRSSSTANLIRDAVKC